MTERNSYFSRAFLSQIVAIQEEQVEGEEDTLASAEEQIVERRTARAIDASDLAIEDGAFDGKIFSHPRRKVRKSTILDLRRYRFGLLFVATAATLSPKLGIRKC